MGGVSLAHHAHPISTFRAAVQSDGTLELLCYGEIIDSSTLSLMQSYGYDTEGFISSTAIKKAIDQAGRHSSIRVRINSPGGDAFEGIAIHNILRSTGKRVETCVDGVAASAASIIAMAGDVRSMGHNAMMMVHNAWSACVGFADDMRQCADTLDKVSAAIRQTYVDATGQDDDYIQDLMDAETWLSSDDCIRDGFATEIADVPEDQQAKAMTDRFRARAETRAKSKGTLTVKEAQRQLDEMQARRARLQNPKTTKLTLSGRAGLEEAKLIMRELKQR